LAAEICEKDLSFAKVVLLSSIPDKDPRVVRINSVESTVEYSLFCIKEMWKYVDTEYALVFQYDGFILNSEAWNEEFLKYDYVGAPWYHMGDLHVGNGGFSLRSKKLLDFIGKNYKKIGGELHPEDLWISEVARPYLEKEGMGFATEKVALDFSKNGNEHGVIWNGEFGWHGKSDTDISKWFEKNPEYKGLIPQNLTEFAVFMKKYGVYDGTFHVLQCKPIHLNNYKNLSFGKKNYDCRIDLDLTGLDEIKPNHKLIYKLFRISQSKVGIPTFERTVSGVEKFSSKKELLSAYPEIQITPSFMLPKWKQRLATILGNMVYPSNKPYTLIWFVTDLNK
jgi:hypothetical protein